MFVAPDDGHVLIDADYSQIELRVLAHISRRRAHVEAFQQRAGYPCPRPRRRSTGCRSRRSRRRCAPRAKAVNFGIVYGISGLSASRSNRTLPGGRPASSSRRYFARYPGVRKFMDACVEKGRAEGYVDDAVRPPPARCLSCTSPNFNVPPVRRARRHEHARAGHGGGYHQARHGARARRFGARRLPSRLILQVHDELILEAPRSEQEEAMRLLKEEMEAAFQMDAPARGRGQGGAQLVRDKIKDSFARHGAPYKREGTHRAGRGCVPDREKFRQAKLFFVLV